MFDFLFGAIVDWFITSLPRPVQIALYTLFGLMLAALFAWLAFR